MSTDRATIRQEMHDLLYAGNRGFRRLRNGPDATGLTEFSSNMTSITDTAFKETMLIGNDFIGEWIRLKYVDNASAVQERVSRIHSFDATAGTINFSPAIGTVHGTAATVNGEYEIWIGCHPDEADNAINRVLENLVYRTVLPVSLVTDGDMEDTSAWTAISTPATREKATAVTLFGRQNLHLIADAASEGATSANVLVTPNEPLYLSTAVRADVPDWTVALYDATNSANIETATITDTQLLEVRFYGNAPSDCNAATVRFTSGATDDEIYIGPVSLLSGWRKRYPVDTSSVIRDIDILSVFTLPQGTGAADDDTFVQYPDERIRLGFETEFDERAGIPLNIVLDRNPWGAPIFMDVQARHPTVSADATAIVADKDTVVNGALYYVYRAMGNDTEAYRFLRTYNRLLEKQGYAYGVSRQPNRVAVRMGG